jgi:hypothetical protein
MTVERIGSFIAACFSLQAVEGWFELVTDCLVCMGFLFKVWFLFWFFPACVVCAGSCAKAESPPETRHDCASFFDRHLAVL